MRSNLIAGRSADASVLAAMHPPLFHPSLLGFLDEANGGGSLTLTGGRGLLEFDPQ